VSTRQRRAPIVGVLALVMMLASATACTQPPPPNPTTPGEVKIRYGPFTIPAMNQPSTGFAWARPLFGLPPERGSIWNQPVTNVRKPCDNCFITGMVAGLEYADGSNANINTGVWLHHMVGLSQGTGRQDATCAGNPFSLPHFAVGTTPGNSERFFASGNERTPLQVPADRNVGYRVNSGDRFHLIVDLMNETMQAKQVYLTMTYKVAPSSTPGMRPVKPIWLDAAQCGTSEVPARTGKYQVKSVPWTSTVSGQFVGMGGHLHDGGTNITIEQNGQVICDSVAKYGTKPDFISPGGEHDMDHGGGGDHGHGAMQHISEHSVCLDNLPRLNAGDRLAVTGYYDDSIHPQMVHDGQLHTVMAIAIAYVAQ
jgi:hypothetical protein